MIITIKNLAHECNTYPELLGEQNVLCLLLHCRQVYITVDAGTVVKERQSAIEKYETHKQILIASSLE